MATVASGHATLATKRTLLLNLGPDFHRLDRTSLRLAHTYSITSSARTSPLGDSVHIFGGAPVKPREARPVGHETPRLSEFAEDKHHDDPTP